MEDLLYVGERRRRTLERKYIRTIGDLANADAENVHRWFGKVGDMLRTFARGEDMSPVMQVEEEVPVSSVGNSVTTPVDVQTMDDVRCVYTLLMESVSARLREQGLRGRTVHIYVRRTDLTGAACQRTIKFPTSSTREIVDVAMRLFHEKGYEHLLPFRSLGITVSNLSSKYAPMQMDLFGDEAQRTRDEALEDAVYWLKQRYGQKSIELAICTFNNRLRVINPKEEERFKPPAPAYYFGGEEVHTFAGVPNTPT